MLSIILGAGLTLANLAQAANFPEQVKVDEGVVKGAINDKYQAVEWWGIPYAKPAVGENRWTAPKRSGKHVQLVERTNKKGKIELEKEKTILDCTKFAPANIQFNGKKVIGEEGVLTLDITRPDTTEKKLPVMVFFHGGNNQTSNSRLWMGQKFAKEANAVYVSVQFRLGALGFNNLPAVADGNKEEQSGNFGFLDQAAALDWVKDNIKSFGGDPDNITVSGFSAGGRDVMAMLISPVFKGKFNKAVSFSGGCTVANYQDSQRVLARKLAPLAVEDKLQPSQEAAEKWLLSQNKKDKKAVRKYLMEVPAERIAPLMSGALIRMSAFPHLYGDGHVLPKQGFKTKKFNSVPLIMLASSDEFTSFLARDPYFKNRMNELGKDEAMTKEYCFANNYGSALYGFFNGQESALNLHKGYKAPMYVSTFNFGHTSDVVGEKYNLRNGAFHGVWLPFLTDQSYPFKKGTEGFNTPGAKELSKAFIASLAAFMRTGNPNCVELGHTWEKWNPTYRPELVFDASRHLASIYSLNSKVSYAGILAQLADDSKSVAPESKKAIIHNVLNGRWFSEGLDKKYQNKNLWK